MRHITVVSLALAVVAVVALVAGCGGSRSSGGGGGGGGGGGYGSSSPSSTGSSSGASAGMVKTASGPLGTALVDGRGHTLYLFESDHGSTSTCSGACAQAWPPLTASGKPAAATGAKASLLGTITRADGKKQVTYGGHPLYLYGGDANPGDANGQGSKAFGAEWYALAPSGQPITSGS